MALHLHNNRLRSIPALSFMNLPVLSLLNLASNRIASVHRQALLNTPQIRFLYISDNQLGEVQPHQFSAFEQLEMVDLSNNRIEVLPNDSFSNLASIKQIFLGGNRIAEVEEFAFHNSSVVILILEGNALTEVRKGMFSGATKLQQISLKENKIHSVDPNAFYHNPALVMVDLSHNQLIDLAPATFLSQLNMLLVDLSNNRLLRTPYSAFNRRVVTVLLQENPLFCTERVHMLQQGVGVYVPNSNDLICRERVVGQEGEGAGAASAQPAPNTNATVGVGVGEEEVVPDTSSPFIQQQPTLPSRSIQSNIRPIGTGGGGGARRISTSSINQFVDQAQFPTPETSQPPHESIIHPVPQHLPTPITSSSSTSSQQPVDPANDPNQIYPLPVPFLQPPKEKIHTAQHVYNGGEAPPAAVVVTQTLPPSILIAPRPYQPTESVNEATQFTDTQSTTPSPPRNEEFELSPNGVVDAQSDFSSASDDPSSTTAGQARTLPTAIVAVCLITVGVVMCAVFVGMCVAKQRQIRLLGSNASSTGSGGGGGVGNMLDALYGSGYGQHHQHFQHLQHQGTVTNSYMAAAAAHAAHQQNVLYGPNGTLPRGHGGGTLNGRPLQDDIYGWIYSPGSYTPYARPSMGAAGEGK